MEHQERYRLDLTDDTSYISHPGSPADLRSSGLGRTTMKIWSGEGRGQMMCFYSKAGSSSLMFQKHKEKLSNHHKVRVGGCVSGKTK